MNDNSLYAQLAATSLQIVNWAHGNHLMVIISTLQLTIRLIFCISVSPCRPGSGSDCCRSPLTIMILNVCRYVGCMKISWKCFEGRPLRGFYQMPSKYSELFLNAIILAKMSGYWSVSSLGLLLLIRILQVPHGSNHFEGCH